MSFAVGGPGKPANGAMAEALLEIIRSNLRQICEAFDGGLARGLSADLATTHAAVIVDGRTSAGREFLCQAGFHGGWVETEFPVLLLARSAIADLLGGRMNGLLGIPTTPGTLLVIAIGAGSEDGSATIAAKEVRYRRPLWMPGA